MFGGSKMMFDWSFEFSWFVDDDSGRDVPIAPGGIELLSRRRWLETQYDSGMYQWGGENIEQSLCNWICGGRILVDWSARVGHVFDRPKSTVVRDFNIVVENHARAAFVWLDDYLEKFQVKHYAAGQRMLQWSDKTIRSTSPEAGDLSSRLALRHRLGCGRFEDFVGKFSTVFDQRGLFVDKEFSLMHVLTGLCLGVFSDGEGKMHERPVHVEWSICKPYDKGQRFIQVRGDALIRNALFERCLEKRGDNVILSPCEFVNIQGKQIFQIDPNGLDSQYIRVGVDGEEFLGVKYCLAGLLSYVMNDELIGSRVSISRCPETADIQDFQFRQIFSGL
jgi:hypothetical protein